MSIEYQNKPIDWDNAGVTPPQDLIEKGFQPGYKPPAEYFNAILHNTSEAIKEIQEKTAELTGGDEKSAGKKVEGETFVINNENVTAAEGAEIFNYYFDPSNNKQNKATGKYSTAMGYNTLATGNYAVAMGLETEASGFGSFAMGRNVHATGGLSIAMGYDTHAIGSTSVALGYGTHATGINSFAATSSAYAENLNSVAMGYQTHAIGQYSFAAGKETKANGHYAVAMGLGTTANNFNHAIGLYNKAPTGASDNLSTSGDLFIIGNGTGESSLSNAFRITKAGNVMGTKSYTASGADYAEMFEWADGNPDNEDRRGLFVTLDGEKIRPASADDDYILGVVSATPSVVADAQTDDWGKKWKTDIFGERLLDENGAWILNENFREEDNESYVSRLDRKEWAAVGLVGKLIVVDDGTCEVNGYCKPAKVGTATKSETGYRVLSRIDENHIKVLIK